MSAGMLTFLPNIEVRGVQHSIALVTNQLRYRYRPAYSVCQMTHLATNDLGFASSLIACEVETDIFQELHKFPSFARSSLHTSCESNRHIFSSQNPMAFIYMSAMCPEATQRSLQPMVL